MLVLLAASWLEATHRSAGSVPAVPQPDARVLNSRKAAAWVAAASRACKSERGVMAMAFNHTADTLAAQLASAIVTARSVRRLAGDVG